MPSAWQTRDAGQRMGQVLQALVVVVGVDAVLGRGHSGRWARQAALAGSPRVRCGSGCKALHAAATMAVSPSAGFMPGSTYELTWPLGSFSVQTALGKPSSASIALVGSRCSSGQ
jgi:hypothetical protein